MALLNGIVRFALRFRGAVIALACLLAGYGLYSLGNAKYDVFPEFTPPEVGINTEAPGLSPEQVEMLVTQPIENSVDGASGVDAIRSDSIQGISDITIIFDAKSDIYRSRQLVAERLAGVAGTLPREAETPVITPLLSSTGDVMSIGLTSTTLSQMELRSIADWIVRPHLLAVPGVASVPIYGGEVRQIQVQLDPEALLRFRLSAAEVLAAARQATAVEGAGFVETPNQRMIVETEGQSLTPARLAGTVVRWSDGRAVTLGEVARVVDAPAPAIGAARVDGKPGVIVRVRAQYGANTLEVSRGVDRALAELEAPLGARGVRVDPNLFRAASFIEVALHNVRSSLLLGAVLVVAVLFLFLLNLRTAAISCTAIPLSLIAAVAVLGRLGYSLNTMTMGGLAIAIGEVVDDAVIDVENILRRLIENRGLARPRKPFRVVFDASVEVRGAVVYATFCVVLVFLPIMTLSGIAGRMFAPLGAAYILAILASLGVALTLTPALCLTLLRPEKLRDDESAVAAFLKRRYERLLDRIERHRGWVVGGAAACTLAGLGSLLFLSPSFLPELRERNLVLHIAMAPGTSLGASVRHGEAVARRLLALPEVASVGSQLGRASLDDVRGPEGSEFWIALKPDADAVAAEARIRDALTSVPGATYSINSFLTERVNETLSGGTAPVVVRLFGNDLDQLDAAARKVSGLMLRIPGAAGVQLGSPPGMPELVVRLRPADLRRWGFTPVEAMDAVRLAYEGEVAGQIHQGAESYDVVVVLDPAVRDRVPEVGRLLLRNPDGRYVPLARVADVFERPGRSIVQHEAARRVETVSCDVAGRPVSAFVAEAKRRIAGELHLPPTVLVDFAGSAEEAARSATDLLVHAAIAGVGILLLLAIVLRRLRNVALVLVNLPFALVGGVLAALAFNGGDVSLGTLVGFVTVFGITLRNSIMLISHYEHLVRKEGQPWGLATAIRGASERLVPILMTALVTALGLLPLAIGRNAPGREIEGPMALAIFGGLATSTLLNLVVLPTLALRYGAFGALPEDEEEE